MSFFSRITRTINKKPSSFQAKRPPVNEPSLKVTKAAKGGAPTPQVDQVEAQRLIFEAQTQARDIVFSAKEEAIKLKTAAEQESRHLREEVVALEKRIVQKEETLDTRLKATLAKEAELTTLGEELEKLKQEQLVKLQKIANLSLEEAKEKILAAVEEKSRNEAGKIIRDVLDAAKVEAAKKAREILVSEMLHGATDYVAEYTVSTINVASEEVKGRIIGKEGRNIRAFEQATGVDVNFDEEGVIRLSCFDSVRREIARVALERLIKDSRIQPSRIEEVVNQVKKEVERIMFEEGEKLCHMVGVYNLPRPIMEVLGKFKYRFSYGQNMIVHTLEETKLGIALAQEVGADVNVVRLGCLLHDIGKVIESEEGSHVTLGAQYLRKMGLPENVVACVEEHHEDRPFSSVESMLVYLGDAISGSRPGARYEDVGKYLERMKQLEDLCRSFDGVNEAWVFQAGREIRVLTSPEKMTDNETAVLAQKIREKIELEVKDFPGQIKVTVIRELRVTQTTRS